jgi:small-conductance mechanosensitive channel
VKRVRKTLLAVLMALGIWAVGLTDARVLAQDTQPTGAISVEQGAEMDLRIRDRIRDIMEELDGYENVRVAVSEGIVTLTGSAVDAASVARLTTLAVRVDGVVAIENTVRTSTNVAERLDPVFDRFVDRARELLAVSPLLLVAALLGSAVASIGVLLARWKSPFRRMAPNTFIADIYRSLIRLAFGLAGVVVALDIMGATALLGTLLGAAGIVGLAVGFAVRDTVENFIASIMLSLRQPFRPNDFIEIAGDTGSVIRLTSRATILLDPNGNHIRIPNATVFKSRIINYTRNAERRFDFTLGVAPDTDLALVQATGMQVLQDLPFVLDTPAPAVWIEEAGESTINVRFLGWIDQQETSFPLAKGEALRMMLGAMGAAGIALPEPTYRLLMPGQAAPEPPIPAPATDPVAPAQLRPDDALEDMVEAEREELSGSDLLSQKAPEE